LTTFEKDLPKMNFLKKKSKKNLTKKNGKIINNKMREKNATETSFRK